MTRLIVEHDACSIGVRFPAAVMLQGIDQSVPGSVLDTEARRIADSGTWKASADDREVSATRALYARLGYPRVVPSGEQLRQTFNPADDRTSSALVRAIHLASYQYAIAIGAYDTTRLPIKELRIWRASGTEHWCFGQDASCSIPSGDLVYGFRGSEEIDDQPVGWLGAETGTDQRSTVGRHTATAVVVILGNEETPTHYTCGILRWLAEVLVSVNAVQIWSFLLVEYASVRRKPNVQLSHPSGLQGQFILTR